MIQKRPLLTRVCRVLPTPVTQAALSQAALSPVSSGGGARRDLVDKHLLLHQQSGLVVVHGGLERSDGRSQLHTPALAAGPLSHQSGNSHCALVQAAWKELIYVCQCTVNGDIGGSSPFEKNHLPTFNRHTAGVWLATHPAGGRHDRMHDRRVCSGQLCVEWWW